MVLEMEAAQLTRQTLSNLQRCQQALQGRRSSRNLTVGHVVAQARRHVQKIGHARGQELAVADAKWCCLRAT